MVIHQSLSRSSAQPPFLRRRRAWRHEAGSGPPAGREAACLRSGQHHAVRLLLPILAAAFLALPASAQTSSSQTLPSQASPNQTAPNQAPPDRTSQQPPSRIGNRANGLDYQPRPGEVRPAERQAGVAPGAARERAENAEIERIDRNALRSEGMSTRSVPNMNQPDQTPGH